MIEVPLEAVPSQILNVTLGGQYCVITLYALDQSGRLYFDLEVGGSLIRSAILVHDRNYLVRETYLGFAGDLAVVDTQGTQDPNYSELGTRYVMVYQP